MDLIEKVERWAKITTAGLAIGVATIYTCGYLSLRVQMTILGIPAEAGAFDERYLFSGASFLISLARALYQSANIAIRIALVLTVLFIAVRLFVQRLTVRRVPLAPLTNYARQISVASAIVAASLSFVAIAKAQPWLALHDLVFLTILPDRARAIAGEDDEGTRPLASGE